jgi:hypothetical protein
MLSLHSAYTMPYICSQNSFLMCLAAANKAEELCWSSNDLLIWLQNTQAKLFLECQLDRETKTQMKEMFLLNAVDRLGYMQEWESFR